MISLFSSAAGAESTHSPGSLDSAFDPGFGAFPTEIRNVVLHPDGRILVCGFALCVGAEYYPEIAQFHANGEVDSSFAAALGGHNGVYGLARQSDGKILFGSAPGDGDPNARLVRRLDADGSPDTTFVPFQGGFFAWGKVIVELESRKILVGGVATLEEGNVGLLRFHEDGLRDTNFAAVVLGAEGGNTHFGAFVNGLVVEPDGRILIAGRFSTINGRAHKGLARLRADGTVDENFVHTADLGWRNDPLNPIPSDDRASLSTILRLPDGRILAGGNFDRIQGLHRTNLARLNADGSVEALAVQTDGAILIGGAFTLANGVPRAALARLHGHGPLRFTHLSRQPDGAMDLTLSTQPTKRYALERSSNLATWISSQTNTATGYQLQFNDGASAGTSSLFYRVRLVEP